MEQEQGQFVNKLAKFRQETKSTWRLLQDITGISTTTLMKIASHKSAEEIGKITLTTYLILKDKLKIDLSN